MFRRTDSINEKNIQNIGKAVFATLLIVGSAQAGLETEIAQHLEIQERLHAEVEAHRNAAKQAYMEVVEFVSTFPTNKEEQLKRLHDAYSIWDEFIEKTCRAEVLESIGTRAEQTNELDCMVRKFKEKEEYFKAII